MNDLSPHTGSDQGTAAQKVADGLAGLILAEFAPGSRLPSESDLAERFSVSRLTLREAMKFLVGRGIIDVARGRRAVVRQPDSSAFTQFLLSLTQHDPKGRFDLLELRHVLEVQSASLAAQRASRAAIVALESAMDGMRRKGREFQATGSGDAILAFHQHDYGFHEALAMASGNRVLSYLFEAMAQPLKDSFRYSHEGRLLRGETYLNTISEHEYILECVKEGKVKASADAMRRHMKATEFDIRERAASR